MSKKYTITVTDEVEAALQKVAAKDGITTQEVVEHQLNYYIGCALYENIESEVPLNTPGLGPKERTEAYAIAVNKGIDEAKLYVKNYIDSMKT